MIKQDKHLRDCFLTPSQERYQISLHHMVSLRISIFTVHKVLKIMPALYYSQAPSHDDLQYE